MAATSSSDSARRSLSSERTRDLVSYDLLFTPCHPEIRDKFDMGYSQWEFFVDLCVNFLVRPTRISPRQSVRGRRAVCMYYPSGVHGKARSSATYVLPSAAPTGPSP